MDNFLIHDYNDFCDALIKAGFSTGSPNSEGIFTLCSYFTDDIKWHTELKDTDPWEWRMRILNERKDIAYAKLFFSKSGYITKDWYPYFYCARRGNSDFYEEYKNGTISYSAKRIYDLFAESESLPLHDIKKYGGFSKDEKSDFDKAIIELQMKLYITMCGNRQKVSMKGEEYGWSSTVFCKVEDFFDNDVFEAAGMLTKEQAEEKIKTQINALNESAQIKKINKFIYGK